MRTEHGLEDRSSSSETSEQGIGKTYLTSESMRSFVEQPSWEMGSFVVSLQGDGFCYIDINLAAANLLGLEADQIIGKPFEQVLPSDRAALIRQNCQSCINRGVSLAYEQQIPIEGKATWWLTCLNPVRNSQGQIDRIIGTYLDITEQKATNLGLQQLNQALEDRIQDQTVALKQSEELFHQFSGNIKTVFWMRDWSGTILYLSPSFEKIWGIPIISPEQSLQVWLNTIHPDDRERITAMVRRGNPTDPIDLEYRILRPDGEVRQISERAFPICDPEGQLYRVAGISEDITERKQAETALQISESRYRSVVAALTEGIVIHAADGSVITCNASAREILGLAQAEEIFGLPAAQLLRVDSLHPCWHAIREDGSPFGPDDHPVNITLSTGQPQRQVIKGLYHVDGSLVWISLNSQPLSNSDGVVCSFTDITARRQAEAEIHRSRDLLRAVFQESADAIFLVDPVSLLNLDCNQRAVELFQASSQADLIGVNGASLHRFPFSVAEQAEAQHSLEQWGVWSAEIEYRTLQGYFFWGNIAVKQIQLAEQNLILVRITDISYRKRSEMLLQQQAKRDHLLKQVAFCTRESFDLDYILSSSIEQLQSFLQVDRLVIYQFQADGNGKIVTESVSQSEFAILGQTNYDPCFQIGAANRYRLGRTSVVSDISDSAESNLPACYVEFLAGLRVRAIMVVPILQSQQLWGLVIAHHSNPRQWDSFELDLLSQLADHLGIAIRQTTLYSQLESQLQQKETLLKEVHHRVKNNLQVVSAMLKLQSRTTQNAAAPNALTILEDSRSRLQAIALIHEVLYQSDDLEQLDFDQYIQRLAQIIWATHSPPQQVSLTWQLQPLSLNLDTAVPCGLLLSELITNAIKHAFPNGRSGEIRISIKSLDNCQPQEDLLLSADMSADNPISNFTGSNNTQYCLTIQDNGIGLPADFDVNQLSSLGLKIVYDLVLQLQGELILTRSQGTTFQLIFSELQYRRRL